jgi:hypothetical protein
MNIRAVQIVISVIFLAALLSLLSSEIQKSPVIPANADESGMARTQPAALTEKQRRFGALLKVQPKESGGSVALNFYRENYDVYGPQDIIAALNDTPFCHALGHNFGRVVYERTRDLAEATMICGPSCSNGCTHGVLMQMFMEKSGQTAASSEEHVKLEDLSSGFTQEIQGLCKENSPILLYTPIGNCYHAVGHALAILGGAKVRESLDLCKLFEERGWGAMYYCATGVYMERDIQHAESDAKVSKIYPCANNPFPAACFRYKLRSVFNFRTQLEEAQNTCLALTGSDRSGCFHGLGFGAYRIVYQDPIKINEVCKSGDDLDKRLCMEGVFGFTNIYDRKIAARACEAYTAGSRELCEKAAMVSNFGMERDFEPYVESAKKLLFPEK